MRIFAFIFARGGSKGIPRKNLRMLGDMPLISHSILQALACTEITRVIVSTDDKEIAEIAVKYGAEVPFYRPEELSGDYSSEFDAWKHAVNEIQKNDSFDIFISLPATSPLRSQEDIQHCLSKFTNSDADTLITVKEASRSPYFNMVKINDQGYSELAAAPNSCTRFIRRQDVPKMYDMTTVAYVSTPEFIISSNSVFDGTVKSVIIPDERAIDIDTPLDFEIANFLYLRNKNNENS